MVVSIFGRGNSGLIEFAVFRWDGEAWQFVDEAARRRVDYGRGA